MKNENIGKAISKKVLVLFAAAVLLSGCGNAKEVPVAEPVETRAAAVTEPEVVVVERASAAAEAASSGEAGLAELREALKGDLGEGEAITELVLNDTDLRVVIDISNADPAPLTLADLAWSRACFITDTILEYPAVEELWETITLDFGEVGSVVCSEQDVVTGEYGRYIPAEMFNSLIGLD